MADDDLFSLDFTSPGTLESAPPPAPAPAIPAPLPAAAPPAPAAAPRPRVPAALEDAATLHAGGQEIEAVRRLEAALKGGEDLGGHVLQAWGGLFDLLQALGRRPAFDSLALAFAKRFEKSPPTWAAGVAEDHLASASQGGRAHVALAGALDASVGEVLKQAMKLAQTSSLVRIDLNKLADANNDGATLLMRALAALKKAKKDYVLGGPEHLAQILATRLVAGERRDEPMWLLLLELYQQAFRKDEFEEAAVNYAVTFEVSPPSWEAPSGPRAEAAAVPSAPVGAEGFSLRGQMVGASAADFVALDAALAGRDELSIDARQLVRIDAGSARLLRDALDRLKASGKRVRITGLAILVAIWLEMQGVAEVADLQARSI